MFMELERICAKSFQKITPGRQKKCRGFFFLKFIKLLPPDGVLEVASLDWIPYVGEHDSQSGSTTSAQDDTSSPRKKFAQKFIPPLASVVRRSSVDSVASEGSDSGLSECCGSEAVLNTTATTAATRGRSTSMVEVTSPHFYSPSVLSAAAHSTARASSFSTFPILKSPTLGPSRATAPGSPPPALGGVKKSVSFNEVILEKMIPNRFEERRESLKALREEEQQRKGSLTRIVVAPSNSVNPEQQQALKSLAQLFGIHWRSEKGARPTQEDAVVVGGAGNRGLMFGVFDGHNGSAASTFCKDNMLKFLARRIPEAPTSHDFASAMKFAFSETETQFLAKAEAENLDDGSTALVCCLTINAIHLAHCGNSRAVVVIENEEGEDDDDDDILIEENNTHSALLLTKDRRTSNGSSNNELVRHRVRSIGDRQSKKHQQSQASSSASASVVMCAEPETNSFTIQPNMKFLVLASDGIWDVLTPEQCASAIAKAACETARQVCDTLTELALKSGSQDNISIVAIRLNGPAHRAAMERLEKEELSDERL